jgi:hypothetical protein
LAVSLAFTRQSAHRAFLKALRRNTDQDIQTHHRAELGKLDMEETNVWQASQTPISVKVK